MQNDKVGCFLGHSVNKYGESWHYMAEQTSSAPSTIITIFLLKIKHFHLHLQPDAICISTLTTHKTCCSIFLHALGNRNK